MGLGSRLSQKWKTERLFDAEGQRRVSKKMMW
jgi:hypothetical protein